MDRSVAAVAIASWMTLGSVKVIKGRGHKGPQRIFEMHLKRIGDSDWPAAGAIGPR